MTRDSDPQIHAFLESLGANEGYAEELYRLYRSNRQAVPERWRLAFDHLLGRLAQAPEAEENGHRTPEPAAAAATVAPVPAPRPGASIAPRPGDELRPLRGGAARLAANMEASLGVPTATSQRTLPVRLLEENRQALNRFLGGRGQKLSLTPLLGWAITAALREFPNLNSAYSEIEGAPARIVRAHVNLGLAVDTEAKGGGRQLLVPVVASAEAMGFAAFMGACERLVRAARQGQLAPEELQGATISLTNPGTLGTRASVPRLLPGQGAIVAAGAVAYPPGFEGIGEGALQRLGIGKVATLTCTYDHRIIQGAESGAFLARIHALLLGEDGFYDGIFRDLGVPFEPVRWSVATETSVAGDLAASAVTPGAERELGKQAAVFQLVHAFRVRGHLMADTDPLGFHPIEHPELDASYWGLTLWDLDRLYASPLGGGVTEGGRPAPATRVLPLREILEGLRATYCGTLACEFMHLQQLEQRQWLTARMEPSRNQWPLTTAARQRILAKLSQAEAFERLLHARYVGHKRFSLEGAEALIPALDGLCTRAIAAGMREALIGMSHRGRLNVLANIVGKPMNGIFAQFEDADPDSVEGSGDVMYHLGAQGAHLGPEAGRLEISVSPNPSHLEAVDPVLEGQVRARQEALGDGGAGRLVLPIVIHGDAAFAGQGVVAETLNLSQLEGYRTGGTVHIVINNRIGFTTSPSDARSTLYSTDVARMVQAPIWHVNGDDPEALARAIELAFDFRQQFQKDVVVDLVCYRRHGHNETDDPSLTQPALYHEIERHPSPRAIYAERLAREGVIGADAAAALLEEARRAFAESSAGASDVPAEAAAPSAAPAAMATAAAAATLAAVGEALDRLPAAFTPHPKLRAFLERRAAAVRQRGAIDWSLAEALAFGSLLLEGVPLRLTGQDTGRGTFSQRHAVLYDYQTGAPYVPLAHLAASQAPVAIYDSLLSEEAALGFEFGYALNAPGALVLWEAQFGDFVNGAQVMIDQFIAVSQAKWNLACGVVLLLPHGYEGQGPEHSSARMERFLQLAAEDNMTLANCSTAAQYFHLLRRQALAALAAPERRRPLVVFTPKSLLRHPLVASPFAELTAGGFASVLPDEGAAPTARRLVFCSGKIYYDLRKAREERRENATALIRVEQLYPFPQDALERELHRYAGANEWIWAQEEPANMGAWRYMQALLGHMLGRERRLRYAGRDTAASPATGSLRRHLKEQQAIVAAALD